MSSNLSLYDHLQTVFSENSQAFVRLVVGDLINLFCTDDLATIAKIPLQQTYLRVLADLDREGILYKDFANNNLQRLEEIFAYLVPRDSSKFFKQLQLNAGLLNSPAFPPANEYIELIKTCNTIATEVDQRYREYIIKTFVPPNIPRTPIMSSQDNSNEVPSPPLSDDDDSYDIDDSSQFMYEGIAVSNKANTTIANANAKIPLNMDSATDEGILSPAQIVNLLSTPSPPTILPSVSNKAYAKGPPLPINANPPPGSSIARPTLANIPAMPLGRKKFFESLLNDALGSAVKGWLVAKQNNPSKKKKFPTSSKKAGKKKISLAQQKPKRNFVFIPKEPLVYPTTAPEVNREITGIDITSILSRYPILRDLQTATFTLVSYNENIIYFSSNSISMWQQFIHCVSVLYLQEYTNSIVNWNQDYLYFPLNEITICIGKHTQKPPPQVVGKRLARIFYLQVCLNQLLPLDPPEPNAFEEYKSWFKQRHASVAGGLNRGTINTGSFDTKTLALLYNSPSIIGLFVNGWYMICYDNLNTFVARYFSGSPSGTDSLETIRLALNHVPFLGRIRNHLAFEEFVNLLTMKSLSVMEAVLKFFEIYEYLNK